MMGGACCEGLATPHEGKERSEQAECPLQPVGGNLDDIVAIPIVHAAPNIASVASPSINAEIARDRSSSLLDGLLHGIQVVVLVGQGVGQLVGDHGLVLVLVEISLLAE